MKKTFATMEELKAFATELYNTNGPVKLLVDASLLESGEYCFQWIEQKMYTSHTGETHPDEAWVTEAGDMLLIQDIELAHARNIIRMLIRQDRDARAAVTDLTDQLIAMVDDMDDEAVEDDSGLPAGLRDILKNTNHTLH